MWRQFCDDINMTTIPRSTRRFFGDFRFLIGLGLIALSIAGVWLVVSSAQQTTGVLQATRTITPGQPLSSKDLRVVDVALGTIGDEYLSPTTLKPGVVAARTIHEGELISTSATARADASRTTSIVITSTASVPESVVVGTTVEVWSAPAKEQGQGYDAPRILLSEATVAKIKNEDGMLASSEASLELVINRDDVPNVLEAISGEAALSVVPTGAAS